MRRVASVVTGRRTKWLVLALWIVAFAVMIASRIEARRRDPGRHRLLPPRERRVDRGGADPRRRVPGGETTQGLIVYEDKGGIDAADQQKILDDAERVQIEGEDEIPLTEDPQIPFQPDSPPGLVSENGQVAYTVLTVPTDFEESGEWGKNVREIIEEEPSDGMRALLSGDLGFSTDADEVFSDIDTTLLGATVILVLVLLGSIYRAVLVALTPLIVVFFAYTVAQGFIYLLAKGGATVSSQQHQHPDRPVIRGGDRLLPLIGLALSRGAARDRGQARGDGPRPAPLGAGDPRLGPDGDAGDARAHARRRAEHRDARAGCGDRRRLRVHRGPDAAARPADDLRPCRFLATAKHCSVRPRPRRRGPAGALAAVRRPGSGPADPSAGRDGDRVRRRGRSDYLAWKVDYSITSFFKKEVDAVEGFEVVGSAFPEGTVAPMTVLVTNENGPISEADVSAAVEQAGAGGRRRGRHADRHLVAGQDEGLGRCRARRRPPEIVIA